MWGSESDNTMECTHSLPRRWHREDVNGDRLWLKAPRLAAGPRLSKARPSASNNAEYTRGTSNNSFSHQMQFGSDSGLLELWALEPQLSRPATVQAAKPALRIERLRASPFGIHFIKSSGACSCNLRCPNTYPTLRKKSSITKAPPFPRPLRAVHGGRGRRQA